MKRTQAYQVALCGVLGALAVVLLMLGGMVPFALYCCPMLASLLMIPLLETFPRKVCLGWYAAVSLLALLLSPDRETALVFLFLGYYPAVRELLERLPKLVCLLAKLVLFDMAALGMYGVMIFLFQMEEVLQEVNTLSTVLLVLMLLLANVTFLFFDLLLKRITLIYRIKKRK